MRVDNQIPTSMNQSDDERDSSPHFPMHWYPRRRESSDEEEHSDSDSDKSTSMKVQYLQVQSKTQKEDLWLSRQSTEKDVEGQTTLPDTQNQ